MSLLMENAEVSPRPDEPTIIMPRDKKLCTFQEPLGSASPQAEATSQVVDADWQSHQEEADRRSHQEEAEADYRSRQKEKERQEEASKREVNLDKFCLLLR